MIKRARALMVQATGSSAGKTLLCLCLCKIAKGMGIDVVPFKAQNMSNNTVVTAKGGEASAAQWLQAIGCSLVVNVNMSPVVIKPRAGFKSQVLVYGLSECDGFVYPGSAEFRRFARASIVSSFEQLSAHHELVIIEGSGASSEVNLREYDTSNMWLAKALNCGVVLISDIERGGALAALVGTRWLLAPSELNLVKGFVINKFSGKLSLLGPGLDLVKKKTGWPCYGVVPWLSDSHKLPSEDSLWVRRNVVDSAYVGIIIDLPFFCNYNDYMPLSTELGISVLYSKVPPACVWGNVKFVIVPDTTSVRAALEYITDLGWDFYIRSACGKGVLVVGVGAGLLMLSNCFVLADATLFGLGLLSANVSILNVLPLQVGCVCKVLNAAVSVGVSKLMCFSRVCASAAPVLPLLTSANVEYGVYSNNVWGVGVQGLFLNDLFRRSFLEALGIRSCFDSYLSKVDEAIARVACKVVSSLSPEFLSLIEGG